MKQVRVSISQQFLDNSNTIPHQNTLYVFFKVSYICVSLQYSDFSKKDMNKIKINK